jgi:hypothetical protein
VDVGRRPPAVGAPGGVLSKLCQTVWFGPSCVVTGR